MPTLHSNICRLFAVGIFVSVTACATSTVEMGKAASDAVSTCPQPQSDIIGLAGYYEATVSTDEGWSGAARTEVTIDTSLNCMLTEKTNLRLVPTEADAIETLSKTMISWDNLEEIWKVITVDDRGYTHIARGGEVNGDWLFPVLRNDGQASTRQIVFRDVSREGYVWAWQGRGDAQSEWKDRLVIAYKRVK